MTVPAPGRTSRFQDQPSRSSVRSSPQLWCEDELAAFMAILGINRLVCNRVRSTKMKGVAHFLDMTDTQLCQQFGLESPVERLVVRQSLKRLLDIDRWENTFHG